MRIFVVVNLRSRRSASEVHRLGRLFAERGLHVDGPHLVNGAGQLRKAVRGAVKRKFDVVALGGGDGTLTAGVGPLAHRECALGVLPLGTGNSFAQTLGLSGDLEQAVDAIAQGRIEHVDLGVANKTYFANFATIGFASEVAASAPHPLKRLLGTAAYVLGAVRPFVTQRPFAATVRWEHGRLALSTHQIILANGRYYGHQPLLPQATITDGKLAFFTTTGLSHADIVRTYLALALGRQTSLPDAHAFLARRIRINARPRQTIAIDGERLGRTPATFRVAKAALRVCVPAEFLRAER